MSPRNRVIRRRRRLVRPRSRPTTLRRRGDPSTTTDPPNTDGASISIAPPDPEGLPALSDIDPAITSGTLDNGLQYFIRRNDNPGARVEMRLSIDAGSALQTPDQGGGAHFLEHMLFNGTEQFPENELVAVLRSFGASFGADINAYTSYDETVYQTHDADGGSVHRQHGPGRAAAVVVGSDDRWRPGRGRARRRARRMARLGAERQRARLRRDPAVLSRRVAVRGPQADWHRRRDQFAPTDGPLRAFYDDWYRPDNAAVVVVGDIDVADIERQIVERFQPADARGDSPERVDLVVEPATDARAVVFDDPDVSEGFAFVTLPLARDLSGTARGGGAARHLPGTRLRDHRHAAGERRPARRRCRSTTPSVEGSGFVRLLDAPEIFVSADGAELEASTQAVLDEYERSRCATASRKTEVDRAVAARRSAAQVDYDGRDSRQDASYADEYVRHVLEGRVAADRSSAGSTT